MAIPSSNFAFLARHDPSLVRLPTFAEKHFAEDPNACILKLRLFSERLAQVVAARSGLGNLADEKQVDLLDRLKSNGIVPQQTALLFAQIRRVGNDAAHKGIGDHAQALGLLKFAHQLAVWFQRTFGDPTFKPAPFVPPRATPQVEAPVQVELTRLREELASQKTAARSAAEKAEASVKEAAARAARLEAERAEAVARAAQAEAAAQLSIAEAAAQAETAAKLRAAEATARTEADAQARIARANFEAEAAAQALIAEAEARLELEADARASAQTRADEAEDRARKLAEEVETWRRLAEEGEAQFATRLAALTPPTPPTPQQQYVQNARAETADQAIELSEADTRQIIDRQLRDMGWEADTVHLSFRAGTRPEPGRAMAIAEWPTSSGPADYALFIGLELVGIIEAKRHGKDVPSVLQQAKRYARDIRPEHGAKLLRHAPWGEYRAPFVFATNGRPFLEQYRTKSGVWLWDARTPGIVERPVIGWMQPETLRDRLRHDPAKAAEKLAQDPLDALDLRDYQRDVIAKVEAAILAGQRRILIAMATGTGKTRTAIGLMYRLLKARRFGRILFLVDRNALGEQTLEVLANAPVIPLQTFARVYDIKGLDEQVPEAETRLHVATIQAMIGRTIAVPEGEQAIDAGTYDCIVVDECHRGYTLDRELSEREMQFRDQEDYVSKYRRVLDYFDAVAIGLTATPAVHTADIFGPPVARYTYRQAVLDGMLVDHEPPYEPKTKLSTGGIHFAAGENVARLNRRQQVVDTVTLPDAMAFEVEEFNRSVLTESWNRVICEVLADAIDPEGPQKTLIFAATSEHADLVVHTLKTIYEQRLGQIDPEAIAKITGDVDKPLQMIRNFKNERLPTIAVTVDLLTTGVDVPKICNLVFMRRVRSRILYEQMIGRATRLCPEVGKELFRIYDAVGLYAMMQEVSEMQPVSANPNIRAETLVEELRTITDPELRLTIHDQLIARLRARARRLTATMDAQFRELAGESAAEVVSRLRDAGPDGTLAWIDGHTAAFAVLCARSDRDHGPLISNHDDELVEVTRGYSGGQRPEDFIDGFAAFLRDNLNKIPALAVIVQRPRELTRGQLREVLVALDAAGYSEANLRAAYRDLTNEDIAARIVGFIRRQALGSPLEPYELRVDRATRAILARRPWTAIQRKWIERIGKQLVHETVVDRAALDQGAFKSEGGFVRIDKLFDGKLEQVLGDLHDALWADAS